MVTDDATDITPITAVLNGRMTWNGREDADHVYFDWDTDSGEPYANTEDLGPGGEGSYAKELTSLSEGIPYFFRIRAHNSKGESKGAEKTFTTETIVAPTMVTHDADEITATATKLHGEVQDTGWEPPTRYLDWVGEKVWLAGWDYRQKLTIDHTKVPNTDQSDFPVLITEANIKDAFWGHVKADGSDVAVTFSDGVTKLKRELVSIDTVGKTIVLWVKADLSHTIDTELYLYYGNAAAAETNDADTWDANFKMVQHKNDSPDSSHITGSTSLARIGTKKAAGEPVEVAGKVGRAQDYNGGNDYIDFGNVLAFERDDPFELSFIVKPNIGGARRFLLAKVHWAGTYLGYFLRIEADSTLRVFLCHDHGDNDYIQLTSGGTIPDGSYTFVTITYDGSSTAAGLKIYFKLVLDVPVVDKDALTDTIVDATPFRLGTAEGDADYLKGILDEFWASDIVRTADWRETRINNQDSPATFYSVANEEAYYDNEEDCGVGGVGLYEKAISGLTPETTYYFRARGVNSGGTGVGVEKEFTTLAS